jgi:hypothetical protein
MPSATIDRLIINSPYEEPAQHWRYERETRTFDLAEGRRPAGYVAASGDSKAFDKRRNDENKNAHAYCGSDSHRAMFCLGAG